MIEQDKPAFEGWTEPAPQAFNTPTTVLNTIESVVTGTSVSMEQKAARGQVAELYTRTQEEERLLRVEMLRKAVAQGNAPLAQLILNEPQEGPSSFYQQLDKVIANATEKMAVTNPIVTANTPVEKLDKQINKVSNKMSFETLQALIDEDVKQAGVGTYVGEFLSPNLGQGVSVTNALKGLSIPSAYYQGRSRDADAVYNWLSDLPQEERAEGAYRVYQAIRSGAFTTRLAAATFLADVLNPSAMSERVSEDALNKLGTAFDIADIAGVTKAIKFGLTRMSKKDALGQLGQKQVVTEDAKDALENSKDVSTLGQTKGQQIDASTSLSVDKVLPTGLSSAPTSIQQRLQQAAKASIDELQNTIASTGIKQEEAETFLRQTQNKFSTATNPHILKSSVKLSDDLSEIVGEVVYKPVDKDFFETRVAAQRWMENNNIKGEVVENNKNPGFVIRAEERETLLSRKKQLELELSLEAAKNIPERLNIAAPLRTKPAPIKTIKAYKLFRVDPNKPGKLFPLFVSANKPVPMNAWLEAEIGEQVAGGKVKSKLGPLAFRPGWHAGDFPIATHIGGKSRPDLKAPDIRPENQVWAEVEFAADVDWQAEATKRGFNDKGKFSSVRAHITDQLPIDGFYRYKTNANMTGNWLIGGSMKVTKILSDDEVMQINKDIGINDLPRVTPFNPDKFGFSPMKFMPGEETEFSGLTRIESTGGSLFAMEPVFTNPAKFNMKTVGNVAFSDSVPAEALDFIQKINKLLGLEQVPLVIVNKNDSAAKQARFSFDFIKKTNAKGSYIISKDGAGIIRIASNPRNKIDYFTTLAHEYGHFFESAFSGKYSGTIQSLFNDFLASKNIKSIDDTSFGVVLGMRNFKAADEMFAGMKAETFGSVLKRNPRYKEWLNRYDEWFSEQFTKWAFTDEVPTSTLGKTFKSIIDGMKAIAVSLAQKIGIDIGDLNVDSRISTFMREHIKAMQEKSKQVPDVEIPQEKTSLSSPVGQKAQELAEVNKKLEDLENLDESLVSGYVVKQGVREAAGLKAVKAFSDVDKQTAMKGISGALLGFLDPALRGSRELMQGRYIGVHKEARLRKVLTDLVEDPIYKLDAKERQRVEATLEANDAETNNGSLTTEYSYTELRGKGLNENEINAFYSVRLARNILHKIKDGEAALSLRNKGYENVSISETGLSLSGFARKVSQEELLKRRGSITSFDAVQGKRTKVSEDSLNEVYYEFLDPVLIGKGEHRIIKVNPNTVVTSRIDTVVPYRPGEMQRIYEDPFFVRIRMRGEVDDVVEEYESAYKTARTRKEAEGFAKDFYKAIEEHRAGRLTPQRAEELLTPWNENIEEFLTRAANGDFDNVVGAYGHVTRNKEDYLRDYSTFATGARAFNKSRGAQLSKVDKEDRRNTLSPFESLQAEITNVSRVASITQWRDAAIQRWFNEVSDYLDPQTRSLGPEKAFFAQTEKGKYIGSDENRKFAQDVENYVQLQLGMRTKEEQIYEGIATVTADALDNLGSKNSRVWPLGSVLRNAAPIDFLRTYNFHMLLGFFNPAQLIVQTQNLVTMTAVSPKHGLQASKTALLLRVALASDNEAVWRKMATFDNLSSLGLSDVNEFVESVRAIRRSGLLDGINSTSLYTAEEGKFFVFRKNMERVKGASGFFFNRGEEITRLGAFEVARREFVEANPGAMWFNDEGLKAILARQDDLTQNMTRSNIAAYQRGILSIPAQFLQYNLKLLANMTGGFATKGGRGYTRAQSARILATHLVAYGVAYNGLGMFLEELVGSAIPEDWDEEKRLYISQGAIAGLVNSLSLATTGEQTALGLGQRLGTFGFFSDFLNDLSSEDSSFLEVFAGPSVQAAKTVGALYDVGKLWVTSPMTYDAKGIASLQMLMQNSSATLSNATKAYIAMNHYNTLMSRSGKPLAQVSNSELFFQALGIPSAATSDLNKLYITKQDYEKRLKELVTEVRLYQQKASDAYAKGDKQMAEEWMTHVQGIMQGVSYEEQKRIIQATRDIRQTPMLEKNLTDYLQGAYGPRKPLITEQ